MIIASSKFDVKKVSLFAFGSLTLSSHSVHGSNIVSAQSSEEKHFLYDIVANGRNGIDVDKYGNNFIRLRLSAATINRSFQVTNCCGGQYLQV